MRAVFRVDASATIGGGHLMRCLTLADALADRGWTCSFICVEGSQAMAAAARNGRHCLSELNGAHAHTAEPLHATAPADLLVIDHYDLDATFETACRRFARMVMVVEDRPTRRHDCDILLDQTEGRHAVAYSGLVPRACTFLLGARHALLRPQFAAARQGALVRRDRLMDGQRPARLLISLGGTDPRNIIPAVLQAVRRPSAPALAVDIAVGRATPNLPALAAAAAATAPAQIRLHLDARNMATLMTEADIAIGGGGISTWERCCLGLPTLLLVLAENQRNNARALEARRAAIVLDCVDAPPNPDQIARLLRDMVTDWREMGAMGRRAADLADGAGAARAADAITAQRQSAEG